jgi:hypothetical protein
MLKLNNFMVDRFIGVDSKFRVTNRGIENVNLVQSDYFQKRKKAKRNPAVSENTISVCGLALTRPIYKSTQE